VAAERDADSAAGPRVLLCADGPSAGRLLDAALPLVAAPARWSAVHVIDTRRRADLAVLRHGLPGTGPVPPHLLAAIDEAGRDNAERVMAGVAAALRDRGLRAGAAEVRVGEPGRELCAAAARWSIDLVVLFASRRPIPGPGPRSVGHTARFVLDHAPCPVLLVRPRG
jgi:nucleotide-binding universal stress UspA family protein